MTDPRVCVLCGVTSDEEDVILTEFRGKDVCKSCIKQLDESRKADDGHQVLHG